MLNELYYYFVLPLTVSVGILGGFYILYPDESKSYAVALTWNASKIYIQCQSLGDRINSYFEIQDESDSDLDSDDENEKDDTVKQTILMYDSKENNLYTTDLHDPPNKETEEMVECIKELQPSVIFLSSALDGSIYYKRTNDPLLRDTECLTFVEKPFVSVEYLVNDKCVLDIHDNLTGFYVNGNRLLDRKFLEWYIPYFYKEQLDDDFVLDNNYSLRIFDKDVTMFTINSTQYIQLENDAYSIEKVEDDKIDSEKSYEGAEEE